MADHADFTYTLTIHIRAVLQTRGHNQRTVRLATEGGLRRRKVSWLLVFRVESNISMLDSLIAKWKKAGYEKLCCLRCIQTRVRRGVGVPAADMLNFIITRT
jgi:hypothetical protein